MNRRENTFRIDYAKVPKKPTYEELHRFVCEALGMTKEEVKRIQCSRHLGCVFIKASDLSVAQRVVTEHDGKHVISVDGKNYTLRLSMEDGGVDVKLFDLSEDVRDEEIIKFLSDFGEVLGPVRELMFDSKYLGSVPSGIRTVRMIVKKNIPSTVIIDTETTCVAYSGQCQSCRHCNELIHNGITCIQNRKLLLQKLGADQTKQSYANVTKQRSRSRVSIPLPSKSGGSTALAANTKQSAAPENVTNTQTKPVTNQQTPNSSIITRSNSFKLPHQPRRTDSPAPESSQQTKPTSTLQQTDGHETDESTSSNSSKRSKGRPLFKKMRHETMDTIESTGNLKQ